MSICLISGIVLKQLSCIIITVLPLYFQFASSEPEYCYDRPESGRCYGIIERWYYDSQLEKCLQFTYGGCGGNDNNFASHNQCLDHCSGGSISSYGTDIQKLEDQDVCEQSKRPGMCKAHIQSWYYDHRLRECKQFIYSGCKGNGNRFSTKSQCLVKCGRHSHSRLVKPEPHAKSYESEEYDPIRDQPESRLFPAYPLPDIKTKSLDPEEDEPLQGYYSSTGNSCNLPPDGGPCKAMIERWFYNWSRRECRPFYYGGCRGNKNRFDTEEECLEECNNN